MSQRGDALRDMLLVLVGLQTGVLDRDVFFKAFSEWDCVGGQSLVEELLARGTVTHAQLAVLEQHLGEHLRAREGVSESTLPTVAASGLTAEGETLGAHSDLAPTISDGGQTVADYSSAIGHVQSWFSNGSANFPHGRYELIKSHAEGGIGVVSIARDRELNREVALKEIKPRYADDPTSQSRFLLEAEVTGGLEHPGIVPVYGLGVDPHGRPYYAMRFIRGESLKDVILRFHADEAIKSDPTARSLELRKLLLRFLDVCNTIEYAHTRSVLHRDIKPANIMVGPHGETMVVDWGIAKATGRPDHPYPAAVVENRLSLKSATDATETLPGSTLGTPAFMSCEQAKGDISILGPASDVYSLGATLYNILTGKPPFQDGDVYSVLRKVQIGDFPPPRKLDRRVDPSLEAVCLKAMALAPADRYQSAKALAEDVERWMADETVSARTEPFPDRARRWMRRRRTAVTAAAATVLMGIAGLVVVLVVQHNANRDLSSAKDREHERFELAMDAIRTFHTGVSEDFLLKQKEFKSLHDNLLKKAKEFYQKLEDKLKDQSDVGSKQALGRALYELGELTSKVGGKPEAIASHQRALEIRRALAFGPDASTEARRDLGRSLTAIAVIERTVNGMQASAERDYEEALAILESLVREKPGDSSVASALARLERFYGLHLSATKRPETARTMYERSKSHWDGIVARNPSDIEASSELAWCHHHLGDLEARATRTTEALMAYEEGRKIRRKIAEANPGLLPIRSELAASENTIGRLLSTNQRTDEALEAYRRGLAIRQELARANSGVTEFHQNVARSYHGFANLYAKLGKTEAAIESLRSALEIRRELVRGNPTVPLFEMDAAADLFDMAAKLYRIGRFDEAIEAFTECRAIEQKVVDKNTDNPEYLRSLALSHLAFGKILGDTATPAAAIESYGKARDLLKQLTETDRSNNQHPIELAMAYRALAELLGANGQPEAALVNDGLARSTLESLNTVDPSETRPKSGLAASDLETGSLFLREGRNDKAAELLQRATEHFGSLHEKDLKNTEYRQSLAIAEDALSLLKSRTGDSQAALKANENARKEWESLANGEPLLHENREGIARNRLALGECLERAGDLKKAVAAYESARTVANDLARAYPKVRRFQIALAASEIRLGAALNAEGQREPAVVALNHALEILAPYADISPGELYLKACAHSLLFQATRSDEDAARAIAALREALKAGFKDFTMIRNTPALDPIRSREEFKKLTL